MQNTKQRKTQQAHRRKELNSTTIKNRNQEKKKKRTNAKDYLRGNEVNKSLEAAKLGKLTKINKEQWKKFI